MAGVKQSKSVSWAPDPKLCQVRKFISEDAPSQSGLGPQDNLQAKRSWLWHATGMVSDDSLPPGFEALHAARQPKKNFLQIPLIKWRCAPIIQLNPEWLVVTGEESEEVAVQNQRQLGILEAIYPRPSSIPSTPSVSLGVLDSGYDDRDTPLIPITAIEDEDMLERSDLLLTTKTNVPLQQPDVSGCSPKMVTPHTLPDVSGCLPEMVTPHTLPDIRFPVKQSQCSHSYTEKLLAEVVAGAEPDVLAAASAAFTAIIRSNEEGSLIDRDFLIKILSNPSYLLKMLSEHEVLVQKPPSLPLVSAPPPSISAPLPFISVPPPFISAPPPPPPRLIPPPPKIKFNAHFSDPQTTHIYPTASIVAPPTLGRPLSPVVQITAKPIVNAPPAKDVNYYKSLIQQHGGEKEVPDPIAVQFANRIDCLNPGGMNGMEATGLGSKHRDAKPKITKPCAYFNTPRGCRLGSSCSYQHDASSFSQRIGEREEAKRIKLDRGIAGSY